MLTEKEIKTVLEGHVFAGQMTVFKDNYPAGTPIVKGIQEAPAAIAKRLSEGVVWKLEEISRTYFNAIAAKQKGCVVRFEERPDLFIELTCYGSLIDRLPRDGQLVSVTVKIVEGTKDGTTRA